MREEKVAYNVVLKERVPFIETSSEGSFVKTLTGVRSVQLALEFGCGDWGKPTSFPYDKQNLEFLAQSRNERNGRK